jgi:hypothetical protein
MFRSEHIRLSYLGAPINHKDWRGIEQCAWRGSLLSFADCSGVKLYDATSLAPIAHVDQPIGADHATVAVSPCLVFETNTSLLVACGDCFMNLVVTDHATDSSSSSTVVSWSPPQHRRRVCWHHPPIQQKHRRRHNNAGAQCPTAWPGRWIVWRPVWRPWTNTTLPFLVILKRHRRSSERL